MYRRYRPKNKKSNQTLPIVAVSLTLTGLLVWGYFSKWDDIVRYVKGETKYLADNSEANARLDKLIKSLYTDESALIALVDKTTDYNECMGWIKDDESRQLVRWALICRLVDVGDWERVKRLVLVVDENNPNGAKVISPNLIKTAPIDSLDRISSLASRKEGDKLFRKELDKSILNRMLHEDSTAATAPYRLNALRRYLATCKDLAVTDGSVSAPELKNESHEIVRPQLNVSGFISDLKTCKIQAEAASFVMEWLDFYGGAKDDVISKIIKPLLTSGTRGGAVTYVESPALGRLRLMEATEAFKTSSGDEKALRDYYNALIEVRSMLLMAPDRDNKLAECYYCLGDVCFRLGEYEPQKYRESVDNLTLSEHCLKIDGVSDNTPSADMLKLRELRARANHKMGAKYSASSASDDHYIFRHRADALDAADEEKLAFLADNGTDAERKAFLDRCRTYFKSNEATGIKVLPVLIKHSQGEEKKNLINTCVELLDKKNTNESIEILNALLAGNVGDAEKQMLLNHSRQLFQTRKDGILLLPLLNTYSQGEASKKLLDSCCAMLKDRKTEECKIIINAFIDKVQGDDRKKLLNSCYEMIEGKKNMAEAIDIFNTLIGKVQGEDKKNLLARYRKLFNTHADGARLFPLLVQHAQDEDKEVLMESCMKSLDKANSADSEEMLLYLEKNVQGESRIRLMKKFAELLAKSGKESIGEGEGKWDADRIDLEIVDSYLKHATKGNGYTSAAANAMEKIEKKIKDSQAEPAKAVYDLSNGKVFATWLNLAKQLRTLNSRFRDAAEHLEKALAAYEAMPAEARANHTKVIRDIKRYLIDLYDNSSHLRKSNPKRVKELRDSM